MPLFFITLSRIFANRSPRIILIVLGTLVMLVFAASSLVKLNVKREEVVAELERIRGEVQKLKDERTKLHALLEQASTSSFLEKEARKKLNLKKPGEQVVIIVPPKTDVNQESHSTSSGLAGIMNHESKEEEKLSLWERFKKIFFP